MRGRPMFNIICYLGGTCGDLVTAVIDNAGCYIQGGAIALDHKRQLLKKSWQFSNDNARDEYVEQISQVYKSIPSHDVEYHLRSNHSFVAIVVNNKSTATWASSRFKSLHKAHVWEEMKSINQADTVEKYAQDMLDWSSWIKQNTTKTISLEDILNGCLEQRISSIINQAPIDINLYQQWQQQINYETSNNSNQRRSKH
jgi:hypothetical protein